MTDPITIPLTTHQIAQLNAFDAQTASIAATKTAAIRLLVAGHVDPGTIGDWSISFAPQAIVLSPPAKPDIAPAATA